MKRWSAVQEHDGISRDFFENIPDFGVVGFNIAIGGTNVVDEFTLDELRDDEGLKQFESHHFWQPTLMQFEIRTDDDDGTTGVVDTFSKQVLAEATLLAFQDVGQGFELTLLSGRGDDGLGGTCAVVDKRVDRFL